MRRRLRTVALLLGTLLAAAPLGAVALVLIAVHASGGCAPAGGGPADSIALGPPGSGRRVGATEYGGPGDPSSGTVGSFGVSLLAHPDSYAELGGTTFQTARALGGLPYMTPLRIGWGGHWAIAYKRDIGLGGGPIDGLPRVIDLWWQLAGRLGIPYERGMWSGPVVIERPPVAGAAGLLGETPMVPAPGGPAPGAQAAGAQAPGGQAAGSQAPGGQAPGALAAGGGTSTSGGGCQIAAAVGVPLAPGSRAQLLGDGLAAAPRDAPLAVKEIIAAGNQIVGKPYLYGGGHGLALNQIAPAYDCSSSVEHLLYGAHLLPADYGAASSALESFGAPGPGRWVTLYASPAHVFMYVAGLRWDTWNAAGPGDGTSGIGWHPLIRSSAGFVARHPVGL